VFDERLLVQDLTRLCAVVETTVLVLSHSFQAVWLSCSDLSEDVVHVALSECVHASSVVRGSTHGQIYTVDVTTAVTVTSGSSHSDHESAETERSRPSEKTRRARLNMTRGKRADDDVSSVNTMQASNRTSRDIKLWAIIPIL
jgi:hypothetical protein